MKLPRTTKFNRADAICCIWFPLPFTTDNKGQCPNLHIPSREWNDRYRFDEMFNFTLSFSQSFAPAASAPPPRMFTASKYYSLKTSSATRFSSKGSARSCTCRLPLSVVKLVMPSSTPHQGIKIQKRQSNRPQLAYCSSCQQICVSHSQGSRFSRTWSRSQEKSSAEPSDIYGAR